MASSISFTVRRPPRLRPGDRVALCAPSGPVDAEAFARGRAILAARYQVVHDAGLLERTGYLAGSDDRRAEEIGRALSDPSIRAVLCARGGYGLLRILPRLPDAPDKPVVGFSDITALHAWLLHRGVASIHGPNVGSLVKDDGALFSLLEDASPPPALSGLRSIHPGRTEGRLVGGNLTVLSHLCGTPYFPDISGAVLLLEDTNEQPYRIDRMITQLRLSGALGMVAGVALGDFTDCGDAEPVLAERLGQLRKPVLAGLPVGHGERNLALPHGARVRLDADAGTLEFLEGAVS
jgi:muramoyltetrapeptide carboxypeptidase